MKLSSNRLSSISPVLCPSIIDISIFWPGFTHLGIVVDDMSTEIARLADLGIEVSGQRTTSNGWTIAYFEDPEGNILELVQR